MNPAGIFKILVWTAPVLAVLFYFITQRQEAQIADMKVEFAKFDGDFAKMNEGLSSGSEKKEWLEAKVRAHKEVQKATAKAEESNKKADESFAELEKELLSTKSDDFKGKR